MLLLKIKKLTAHNLKIDCTNKLLTSHFCVVCTLARPLTNTHTYFYNDILNIKTDTHISSTMAKLYILAALSLALIS